MTYLNRFLIALLSFAPQLMMGQITSNAFFSEATSYSDGNDDPIFYYTTMTGAQLTAPEGAGNTYNWYSFNPSTGSFDVLEQTGGNALMTVAEKGYRVEINDGTGNTNDFYCWNFVPEFSIDSIGIPSVTCSNIRLTAYTQTKSLVYYNHKDDGSAIAVDYGYSWASTPTGPMDGVTTASELITAPFEDTDYQVELGGKFAAGLTPASVSYFYEAIAVEAAFTFESEDNAENEAKEGSSPMIVRFTDDSKGKVTDWEWTFSDAGKDFIPDPIFTFQKAGEYPVILWVMNSDSGCESESAPEVFTVNELVVKVPSAFTPFSSPGQNDEFKVLYRSVKKYSIVIYNRWGRKVYSGTNPEQGWNGRIGSRKAEPGVYFYTIEAEGYNEGESIKREGAIHLIVTNN